MPNSDIFTCCDCGKAKSVQKTGGTGYAVVEHNEKCCYDCCAKRDREYMAKEGKIALYLATGPDTGCQWEVTNWPGTLCFKVRSYKHGDHNIAGSRIDVWFDGPDGHIWHGVQYGTNGQVCHCKRTKETSK